MKHLPVGTEVRLTRAFDEDEHACNGLHLPEGCRGVLVDEDGDIGFRPTGDDVFLAWCFYLDPEDYIEERLYVR